MPRMPMGFGASKVTRTSHHHRNALEFGGFSDLPDDLKQNILSKLPLTHIANARRTGRELRHVAEKELKEYKSTYALQLSLPGRTDTSIHCIIDEIAVFKEVEEIYIVKLIVSKVEDEALAKRWNEAHFTPLVPGRVIIFTADARSQDHVNLYVKNSPGIVQNDFQGSFIALDQKHKFKSWLENHVPFVYPDIYERYEPFDKFYESRYRDTALGAQPEEESSMKRKRTPGEIPQHQKGIPEKKPQTHIHDPEIHVFLDSVRHSGVTRETLYYHLKQTFHTLKLENLILIRNDDETQVKCLIDMRLCDESNVHKLRAKNATRKFLNDALGEQVNVSLVHIS